MTGWKWVNKDHKKLGYAKAYSARLTCGQRLRLWFYSLWSGFPL